MKSQGVRTDVLIVVATEVERTAVVNFAKVQSNEQPKLVHGNRRSYFDLGLISGARVHLVQCEMGAVAPGASLSTVSEAIRDLSPRYAIMVGIAFGVDAKKQSIGDVLVCKQLRSYEHQRVGDGKAENVRTIFRGDKVTTSPLLLSRLGSATFGWTECKVTFGTLLSGEKLVDSTEFLAFLSTSEPEAVGGEMEGAGLYAACADSGVEWTIVKGICDWADGEKRRNKKVRQKHAASNAASFLIHALSKGGFSSDQSRTTPQIDGPGGGDNPLTLGHRNTLINWVVEKAVKPRLMQELRKEIRIDLPFREAPEQVASPLTISEPQAAKNMSESLGLDEMLSLLAEKRQWLILGAPGAGKTNLILEVANSMLERAKIDESQPIPVIFSLARWTLASRYRPLEEWMIEDLKLFGISAETATKLLASKNAVVLFLDGLDEVAIDRREDCVAEINRYLSTKDFQHIFVSSREQGYAELRNRLELQSAIILERLTKDQTLKLLDRPNFRQARAAVEEDLGLLDVVDTPLWLHVLFVSCGTTVFNKSHLNPRDRLYSRYIQHVLQQTKQNEHVASDVVSKVLPWLGCLAARMCERNQAQFSIEDLDLSWAIFSSTRAVDIKSILARSHRNPSSKQFWIAILLRIAFGASVGLIASHFGGCVFGITVGILSAYYLEGRIEPADNLQFKLRRVWDAKPRMMLNMLLITAALAIDSYWVQGTAHLPSIATAAATAAVILIAVSLFEILQSGFRPPATVEIDSAKSAIFRSLIWSSTIAGAGLLIYMPVAIVNSTLSSLIETTSLERMASWILVASFILALEKGGWFLARHFLVRFLFWFQGCAPLRLVSFLNSMSSWQFMLRRGSTYEFIHITFRDFLARNHHVH